MARAELKTTLSLDTTGFQKALTRAKARLQQFKAGAAKLGAGLLKVGKMATQATAAIAGLSAAMAFGVKKALDLGGRLSDVASRTGIGVKELVVWEEALRQGGMSAEDLGTTVAKLNKNVGEALVSPTGTQATAIQSLNMDLEHLMSLDAAGRFQEVMAGLKGVSNIAQRTQIAEALLGRQGSKLFGVISDTKALQKAVQNLGQGQIDILGRQAERMDRVSDVIGGIGVKVRGFFVGMADELLPGLESAAESWSELDFAQGGKELAKWLRQFGVSLEGMEPTLKGAADKFGEFIAQAVAAALRKVSDVVASKAADVAERIGLGEVKPSDFGRELLNIQGKGLDMLTSPLRAGGLKVPKASNIGETFFPQPAQAHSGFGIHDPLAQGRETARRNQLQQQREQRLAITSGRVAGMASAPAAPSSVFSKSADVASASGKELERQTQYIQESVSEQRLTNEFLQSLGRTLEASTTVQ